MTEQIFAVELRDISIRFGKVTANDSASLRVEKGEIHALVGENGAGKSTLMKILYGMYSPDSGMMKVNGAEAHFSGPRDAIASGIGMVHQHFMLVPPLTVAENVVLGQEPVKGCCAFDSGRARELVAQISRQYGFELDPAAKVETLSVGEQQRLEILKVLFRGAEILILDEPTAVLTPQETTSFFAILRKLKAQGKTVIIITHKLREVMAVSDTVTVMRRGKTVGTVRTAATNEAGLAQMMVGRPVVFQVERRLKTEREIAASPVVLSLEGICAKSDRWLDALCGISFEIRAGEIFGVAGVEGNGQSELIEIITGLRRPQSGRLTLSGQLMDFEENSPARMSKLGVGHVPEDRHRRGLVLDYSVRDNMVLGRQRESQFCSALSRNAEAVAAFGDRMIEDFDIYPADGELAARALSGGNQQKIVVARELSRRPKLLVASQPTRGVDVGAIEFIHRKIIEARDAGAAVLLLSAELSEIMSLSDMIGVIYHGALAGVFPAGSVNEDKIGLLMAGGKLP
ncbi:MAG: ABC transporter ATP-binding protein [Elusimicrobiales bacterium]|nr:ABC transporter ATP-binding protein [Elusimicrobiales bacterium]